MASHMLRTPHDPGGERHSWDTQQLSPGRAALQGNRGLWGCLCCPQTAPRMTNCCHLWQSSRCPSRVPFWKVLSLFSSAFSSSWSVPSLVFVLQGRGRRGLSPTCQFVVSESKYNLFLLLILPVKKALATIYLLFAGHSAICF